MFPYVSVFLLFWENVFWHFRSSVSILVLFSLQHIKNFEQKIDIVEAELVVDNCEWKIDLAEEETLAENLEQNFPSRFSIKLESHCPMENKFQLVYEENKKRDEPVVSGGCYDSVFQRKVQSGLVQVKVRKKKKKVKITQQEL